MIAPAALNRMADAPPPSGPTVSAFDTSMRTAVAKGVSFKRAVLNHGLRNSLIPVATTFGQNIGLILTGSFLIEVIFDIDGFGLLGFNSIVDRDYPVVMGILLISSLLLLVGNILSDVLVAVIDPRIRFR